MPIGYLPDMFGHIAQMPQILRRAGIDDAVVWRGIPAAVERNHFRWRAPDGSEVRAEYLVGGYGQAAYLFAVPETLTRMMEAYHEAMRPFYGDDSLLAMYGTDHAAPAAEMVELVDGVNATAEAHELRIETLAEYLEAARAADRPDPTLVEGEMRSGARANVLMGVASAHMDIKAAAGRAERWLERYAEPFQALYGEAWPAVQLQLAWRRVIENSAHDSICGCSVDAVAAQVLTRFAEAEQLGRDLSQRAVARAAAGAPRDTWLAFNPSPVARQDLVEITLPIPEAWPSVSLVDDDGVAVATQEVARNRPLLYEATGSGADLLALLARRFHGRELFGRQLNGITLERIERATPTWRRSSWMTTQTRRRSMSSAADGDQLGRRCGTGGVDRACDRDAAPDTAGARRSAGPRVGPPAGRGGPGSVTDPVIATADGLANGVVEVGVEAAGTLRIAAAGGPAMTGVGRIVDGGDFGDSYNYGPPPGDTVVDQPIAVRTEVTARGPVAGELVVTRNVCLASRAGARWVGARRGHRRGGGAHGRRPAGRRALRAHPRRVRQPRRRPPRPVPRAAAGRRGRLGCGGQFAVVERGMHPEAGHGEVPLATYPARGFVDAGGVAVLLDHLVEYELVDGRELALTVLRSTGLISRNDNPYREDPAGPERPIPAAQMRGPWAMTFALYPHPGSWDDADVVGEAERYAHPFVTARGGGIAGAAEVATGLAIEGRGVVLSALLRRDAWLEVRLVAETARPTRAVVRGGFVEAREVDLLGRPGAGIPVTRGAVSLELGAWEIRTIQLRR